MKDLTMKCESVIQNEAGTTAIFRSEDRKVRVQIANPPFSAQPGKAYVVTFAEVQEG